LSPLRLPFRHLGTRREPQTQVGNLSKGNAGGNGADRVPSRIDPDATFLDCLSDCTDHSTLRVE
jgi:hypothetical protein